MTETTCPTCGARCEVEVVQHCSIPHCKTTNYKVIPSPDLGKLREAYKETLEHMKPNREHTITDCVVALEHLYQAVQELLEENE